MQHKEHDHSMNDIDIDNIPFDIYEDDEDADAVLDEFGEFRDQEGKDTDMF